ncbi:MAG: Multidrug resistance protein Stp [Chlamydiae bacterium]|nr:Multidrug resistance protein Stp [Chlamydiota bacterium]
MNRYNKWWVLLVTMAATGLVFLDNTIMPVSLPTIQRQMNFSGIGLVWVVNSYLLALMTLMIIGGKLYDLFGMRNTYFAGLIIFGLGSILGGFSYTTWSLIAGRVIQGAGGALLIPTTGALFIELFPPGQRARAIGINTGISSIFLMLGPVVGGFLTEYLGWRFIFWVNLPIVVFGIIMVYCLLSPGKRKKESFHFTGAITLSLAIVFFVVALMEGERWHWGSPLTLSVFAASLVLLFIFILTSRRQEHPLLDLSVFKQPLFFNANLAIFITQFLLMATVLWAIYFQNELHFTPAGAGVMIVLASVPVLIFAPIGGYLADRFGFRLPMSLGFLCLIFSLLWLTIFSSQGTIAILLPGLIPFGCGVTMILSPGFAAALSHVSPEKLGSASGMTTSLRQLAATVGIALMSGIYYTVYANTQSFQTAFKVVSLFAAGLSFLGLLLVFFLFRQKKSS